MENVTNIFSERLKDLRGDRNQADVAQDIGISRGALSYYESGERKPDIEILEKIANYYHVSCDYLIGKTSVKELNIEYQLIENITGLNSTAINTLAELCRQSKKKYRDSLDSSAKHAAITIEAINALINDEIMLDVLSKYLYTNISHFYDDFTYSDEILFSPLEQIGLWDETLGIETNIDPDILSNMMLLQIQKLLPQLREKCITSIPNHLKRGNMAFSKNPLKYLDSMKKQISERKEILESVKAYARDNGIDIDSLVEEYSESE